MLNMFVKNTVKDFDTWLNVFQEEVPNGEAAGLFCEYIWQDPADPNTVFFLLRVDDRARADAYMASPESAEVGDRAGVVDGRIQYLKTA